MDLRSTIELNDSEILALEKGPVAWARLREGNRMDIDGFVRAFVEQVNNIGLLCTPIVEDTNQAGTYVFTFEINGRTAGSVFDPDKMVYEVTNNVLELPGVQKGFIPSKDGIKKLLEREPGVSTSETKKLHKGHDH